MFKELIIQKKERRFVSYQDFFLNTLGVVLCKKPPILSTRMGLFSNESEIKDFEKPSLNQVFSRDLLDNEIAYVVWNLKNSQEGLLEASLSIKTDSDYQGRGLATHLYALSEEELPGVLGMLFEIVPAHILLKIVDTSKTGWSSAIAERNGFASLGRQTNPTFLKELSMISEKV